jgi:hypothetical protein
MPKMPPGSKPFGISPYRLAPVEAAGISHEVKNDRFSDGLFDGAHAAMAAKNMVRSLK